MRRPPRQVATRTGFSCPRPPDSCPAGAGYTKAYEATLGVLDLSDRTDAVTEMIAKKIIEIVKTGERDVAAIGARAIAELGLSPFDQY
jgi:hypothetical protein